MRRPLLFSIDLKTENVNQEFVGLISSQSTALFRVYTIDQNILSPNNKIEL